MEQDTNLDPQGQSGEQTGDPGADAGQSQQADVNWQADQRFLGEGGNVDIDKMYRHLKETESMIGRQSQEVGQLKKAKEQLDATATWWQQNMRQDGDEWVTLGEYERRQAENQQRIQQGNLTPEELSERLREELDNNTAGFFQEYEQHVENRILEKLNQRNAALQDPAIQQFPQVRQRVEQLMTEGVPPDQAKLMAFGEVTLQTMGQQTGNSANMPPLGNSNALPFNAPTNQNRSFISAHGRPAATQQGKDAPPTQDEIAAYQHIVGTGMGEGIGSLEEFVKEKRSHGNQNY